MLITHAHGGKCYYSLVHGAIQEFFLQILQYPSNAPAGIIYSAIGSIFGEQGAECPFVPTF